MAAVLSSVWAFAVVAVVFGVALVLQQLRAYRRGDTHAVLIGILTTAGYLWFATFCFLGFTAEHSRSVIQTLRLLAAMRVCGLAAAVLISGLLAVYAYIGYRNRVARRASAPTEVPTASEGEATWPPPPKSPLP